LALHATEAGLGGGRVGEVEGHDGGSGPAWARASKARARRSATQQLTPCDRELGCSRLCNNLGEVGIIGRSTGLSQLASGRAGERQRFFSEMQDGLYPLRSSDGLAQLFDKDWPLNFVWEISFVFQNGPQFLHFAHATGFGQLECSFQY